MDPMVLLRHDTPDDGFHYDWMLARPEASGLESLITFRARERIDLELRAGMVLERLPDHRRAYLEYQGPLSGNRGRVTRIATGRARVRAIDDTRLDADLRWDASGENLRVELHGATEDPRLWTVRSVVTLYPTDRR